MWILRWFFIVLIMLLILAFAVHNMDMEQTTYVKVGLRTFHGPLIYFLFAAFVVGTLVWFLVSVFHVLQLHSRIRSVERTNKRLVSELTALRNLPLSEETEEAPVED
jgi:uncharacterized integral membrane protein